MRKRHQNYLADTLQNSSKVLNAIFNHFSHQEKATYHKMTVETIYTDYDIIYIYVNTGIANKSLK